jgi:hypothetical protein
MKMFRRVLRSCSAILLVLGFAWACGFDDALREYLDVHFWMPFSKSASLFSKKTVRRISSPFAGMVKGAGHTPLEKLRAQYQVISQPEPVAFDTASMRQAVVDARAQPTLNQREREEVDLIDAKIDMRAGQPSDNPEILRRAQEKLKQFLRTARTPEFLSEARGWLAHIHYLFGEQTAAGKIYLDELNRNGSNLSRESLLNSLRMNYGYDGGPELLAHLEEYFDTPEHAAFAIQLATNPHWDRSAHWDRYAGKYEKRKERVDEAVQSYARINGLLEKHRDLLQSESGANALSLLGMRTALWMGDPPAALKIADMVPDDDAIRREPDFQWMLASARFLSHEYAAAERPLLQLFQSPRSSEDQKAAAAYALCGVYQKTKNTVEQIRFALWLHAQVRKKDMYLSRSGGIADKSVYWAVSGWDLGLLLDAEAPIDKLETFLAKYPDVPEVRVVRYSLAVRLAREERYEESAQIYEAIHAYRRAPRMRQLAALFHEANRTDLAPPQLQAARYKMAEFLVANSNRIYFNDALWFGFQRYALFSSSESRLTREEREALLANERKLKDDQEERWRAYLILRDVVRDAGQTELGRRAANLAIRSLRGLSDRFERQSEIRKADIELTSWLRQ